MEILQKHLLTGALGRWGTGALMCLILLGFSSSAYGLNVAPGRIEVSVAPAKSYEDILIVRNTDKAPLEIKLRVEDRHKAVEGAAKEKSPAFKWLEIAALGFELKEGEAKEIKFKVRVPKEAKGELNAMIFIDGMPKEIGEGAIGINTSIGIPIYVMIKGTERFKAEVEDLKIVRQSPLELAVTIKNSGNVHIRPTGTIEIRDANGRPSAPVHQGASDKGRRFTVPLNEYNYPILPHSSRTLEINAKTQLEQGEYLADIRMGFGDRRYKKRTTLKIE